VIGIEQYGEKTLKNSKKALPRGMRSSKEIFMTQKMYVVK
jgi:hypothetical protein